MVDRSRGWPRAVTARMLLRATAGAASVLLLAGCSAQAAAEVPAKRTGVLEGDGFVIQATEEEAAMLCLGFIRESYPPQCDGVPISDWDWEGLVDAESNGTAWWGLFHVVGRWDGKRFTLTDPPSSPTGESYYTPEPDSGLIENLDSVVAARDFYAERVRGDDPNYVWVRPGPPVEVWVVDDDGRLQEEADERFGEGVVAIEPKLHPTTG